MTLGNVRRRRRGLETEASLLVLSPMTVSSSVGSSAQNAAGKTLHARMRHTQGNVYNVCARVCERAASLTLYTPLAVGVDA